MSTVERIARSLPAFDSRPDLPIALIVGAGGLGVAIAQRLAQSHRIVLTSLLDNELDLAQSRLHELGAVSVTVACDITDMASVEALSRRLLELGPIRSLAHVAALAPSSGDWRRILKVNLVGAALVEKIVLPHMAEGGAAVFVSSLAAHARPLPEDLWPVLDAPLEGDLAARLQAVMPQEISAGAAYGISKQALNRMVRRRAADWGRRGCRILSVSPGLIDTVMGAEEDAQGSQTSKSAKRAMLPLRRTGSMAEVADGVEFLVSARASYITGTDLLIDGGLAAAMSFPAAATS